MFDLQVCRGCLSVNGKLQKLGPTYERMFNNLTGLVLNKRDGYPKYFCWECKLQIRKSLVFARRVKRAHFVLKEIMTVRDQIAIEDVIKVDRTKTNLDSSIGYWKTDKIERNALYQIEGSSVPPIPIDTSQNGMPPSDSMQPIEGSSVPPIPIDTSQNGMPPSDSMQPQKYDKNEFSTCTIVDIQPLIEIDDDVQQAVEQSSVGNQDVTDDVAEDVTNDDLMDTEQDNTTTPEDIDMEDVFKGLEEKQEESDDDHFEDLFPPKHKKRKEKRTHRIPRSNIAYATLGKEKSVWMFLNVDMTVLDHLEQVEKFQLRLQEPKFAKSMFKCGLCVKHFPSMQSLVAHVEHHNAQKEYKFECAVCRDRFKVKDFLEMHVMDSHLYQYTCRLCDGDVVCYSLVDLMAHFKKHEMPSLQRLEPDEGESFLGGFHVTLMRPEEVHLSVAPPSERHVYQRKGKCAVCRTIQAPDVINDHMLTSHGMRVFRAVQCEHCKLYFLKLGSLRRHLREFHTFRYTCKKCKGECYSMNLAKIHAKKCEAPSFEETSLLCSDCGKMCKNLTGLAAHRRIVHQLNSQEHCVICGRPYISQEALVRHQLERHHYVSLNHPLVGDPRYQCERCAVTFLFEQAYHVHLFTMGHDEAKDLDVGCFSCRVYFKNDAQRAAHVCGTAAVNNCPHCEVVLNKASALREHVLSVHPGLPLSGSFVAGRRLCDVCGKHVQPSMFKSHMAGHTELAATLACPRCPLVAQNVSQLAEHVLGAHADRPFVCATCGERFQKKYILSNHLRKIHIKLLCELCNRRFKWPKLLETHMRLIHQIEYKLELKSLKKTSSKLVIHRDMKVDVSLLSDSVIDQLKLEVIDYLDKNPIEVTDKWEYLFKEDNPKSFLVAPTDGKKKKSKKRKIKGSSLKTEVGDVKMEVMDQVQHIEQAAVSSEHNGDSELFSEEPNAVLMNEEVNSGDNVESEMYEIDDMDMTEEVVVEDGTHLTVDEESILEIDGQRMININGVLYKFEDEV